MSTVTLSPPCCLWPCRSLVVSLNVVSILTRAVWMPSPLANEIEAKVLLDRMLPSNLETSVAVAGSWTYWIVSSSSGSKLTFTSFRISKRPFICRISTSLPNFMTLSANSQQPDSFPSSSSMLSFCKQRTFCLAVWMSSSFCNRLFWPSRNASIFACVFSHISLVMASLHSVSLFDISRTSVSVFLNWGMRDLTCSSKSAIAPRLAGSASLGYTNWCSLCSRIVQTLQIASSQVLQKYLITFLVWYLQNDKQYLSSSCDSWVSSSSLVAMILWSTVAWARLCSATQLVHRSLLQSMHLEVAISAVFVLSQAVHFLFSRISFFSSSDFCCTKSNIWLTKKLGIR